MKRATTDCKLRHFDTNDKNCPLQAGRPLLKTIKGGEQSGLILTSDLPWVVDDVAFRKPSLILKGVSGHSKESLMSLYKQ